MWRWLAVAALLAVSAGAETPLPRPKPKFEQAMLVPLPREKPAAEVKPQTKPQPKLRVMWPSGGDWSSSKVAAARAECERILSGINLIWQPAAAIGREGGCGTPAPIEVSAIAGTAITPPATLNCQMAAALHAWVTQSLQPAAGGNLVALRNASSYACRRRNNSSRGKMSEHAFANAFDISEFQTGKRGAVAVKQKWGGLFQKIGIGGGGILSRGRKDACTYFNTVLGPGSDPYHGDHFHVDLAPRRNNYKICK